MALTYIGNGYFVDQDAAEQTLVEGYRYFFMPYAEVLSGERIGFGLLASEKKKLSSDSEIKAYASHPQSPQVLAEPFNVLLTDGMSIDKLARDIIDSEGTPFYMEEHPFGWIDNADEYRDLAVAHSYPEDDFEGPGVYDLRDLSKAYDNIVDFEVGSAEFWADDAIEFMYQGDEEELAVLKKSLVEQLAEEPEPPKSQRSRRKGRGFEFLNNNPSVRVGEVLSLGADEYVVLHTYPTKEDAQGLFPRVLTRLIKRGGGAAMVELQGWGSPEGQVVVRPGSSRPRYYFLTIDAAGEPAGYPVALKPGQYKGAAGSLSRNSSIKGVPIDDFTASYLEAALWSSTGDDERPLDEKYSIDDFSREALAEAQHDTEKFREMAGELLDDIDDDDAGHDFWLTRVGHGVGFWDRDLGPAGDRLTELSEKFGEQWPIEEDRGEIGWMTPPYTERQRAREKSTKSKRGFEFLNN